MRRPTDSTRSVRLCAAVLCAAALGLAPTAQAQDLTVAAASDLQTVFPSLADQFQRASGHAVKPTFGSSGNFFAQIQNGAPFDIFFSADSDYPKHLEAAHLAAPNSLRVYARGRIVLWTRNDSGVDVRRGLAVLSDPRVRRIAIANPEHAPYGRAAVAALEHERLYGGVKSKLVLGENISQAAQFVQSGNADAGLLALSLALAPALRGAGTYVEVPAVFYPPIEQAAVILKASRRKDGARRFLAFLARPDSAQALRDAGFLDPRPAAAAR